MKIHMYLNKGEIIFDHRRAKKLTKIMHETGFDLLSRGGESPKTVDNV